MSANDSERLMVMKKSDLKYIVCSVFAAATAVFYCCTMWFHIKLPRYYPLEHTWRWANIRGVPSQGWYGMQAFAYVAAGILALAVYFTLRTRRFREAKLAPAATKTIGVTVTLLVTVCMIYMLYHEFAKWGIF